MTERPDILQWQKDQSEFFQSSVLEVVTEYAEWRDKQARPALAVWYGPMPESNGRQNYTATLHRKDHSGGLGIHTEGFCFARSEYPDRVRYEADRMRWVIGELAEKPFILDYDADLKSDYVPPEVSA